MQQSWTVAHDFFFQAGGAERVTADLVSAVGADRVLALGGDPQVERSLGLREVSHRLPGTTTRNHRYLALGFPALSAALPAVQGNLLSSSYAFAHHMRARGTHLVYCHSPLRQVWSGRDMYSSGLSRVISGIPVGVLRRVDRHAALRADGYIATNTIVADRVRRYYGLEPVGIIPPPIDDAFFRAEPRRRDLDLLWVGRIVEPYKNLGVLLEAMRLRPDRQLTVVGDGRDRCRLEQGAPANVRFIGSRSTSELADLYSRAQALVFPSEDDFGMVPVEAMATGLPVLALRAGGATETVSDGLTGAFFDRATPAGIAASFDAADAGAWDHCAIRRHAECFSRERFVRRIRTLIGTAPVENAPADLVSAGGGVRQRDM
ncbi:glycosyltransferase [Curtobacterium oceanosedimentum]|uniref:glycosyltransferase n=1 Tax=Curtobacterium oceanosedimentum TaxID=465820 RepID=UPI003398DE3F